MNKIFFKIFSIYRIIIVFYLCFTPFVFIFIKILSFFKINIKFAILHASRIGDFVPKVEIYLSKKKLLDKNSIDIFGLMPPVSNYFFIKLIKQHATILPYYFVLSNLFFLRYINNLYQFKESHLAEISHIDRDIDNILEKIENQIHLNESEINLGYQKLEKLQITRKDKIVCLIVRDSAYLDRVFKNNNWTKNDYLKNRDWSYHNFRDCNVENYKDVCNFLVDQGYTVFRMGKIMKSPITYSSKKIIDYAFSDLNSDFMDIFLGHECKFCISTGTGYFVVPAIFRKPIVYISLVPIGDFWTFSFKYLAIFKHHFLTTEKRYLTTSEIFENEVAYAFLETHFSNKNIELHENHPKEIIEIVKEMIVNIDNKWRNKEVLTKNQQIFWQTFKKAKNNRGSKYYGKITSKISDSFLEKNSNFLN